MKAMRVSMAAIQALYKIIKAQNDRISQLEQTNTKLIAVIDEMNRRLAGLEMPAKAVAQGRENEATHMAAALCLTRQGGEAE